MQIPEMTLLRKIKHGIKWTRHPLIKYRWVVLCIASILLIIVKLFGVAIEPIEPMRPSDAPLKPPNVSLPPPDAFLRSLDVSVKPPNASLRPSVTSLRASDVLLRPKNAHLVPPDVSLPPPNAALRLPKVSVKPPNANLRPPNTSLKLKMRPGLMEMINPSNPKYPLPMTGPYRFENKTLCSSVTNVKVLAMILSSPGNFINRQVLRQTWANGSLYSSHGTVRILFLLGSTDDSNVQAKIDEEFKHFGDILQGFFLDSYHNLTLKSIMGYKWITKRCRNAKYVIKTDDDVVVNMFKILQNNVLEATLKTHHVFCERVHYSTVTRDKNQKSYVEPHQLKGIKYYTPYCNGPFVVMLTDVVPYLYQSAIRTPYFRIDDVHMYGVVMQNIPALKYKNIEKVEIGSYHDSESLKCLKMRKTKCPILYFVTTRSNEVTSLWSMLLDAYH